MLIRAFRVGDEQDLYQVFRSSIHGLAMKDYTLEQLNAWAPETVDLSRWRDRMQKIAPFVAEHYGRPIAYADLQPSGYVDHFYVSAPFARRGIGSMLMNRIHDEAAVKGISVLSSDVSRTALAFFEYWGFAIVEERQAIVGGVVLPNMRMKKQLQHAG